MVDRTSKELVGATALATNWRNQAEGLRRYGANAQALVLEQCAEELETARRASELELLTLEAAASESGYSYSALQKMVASGGLANVGDKNRPRVRRGDLPRKAGRLRAEGSGDEPDLVRQILASRG